MHWVNSPIIILHPRLNFYYPYTRHEHLLILGPIGCQFSLSLRRIFFLHFFFFTVRTSNHFTNKRTNFISIIKSLYLYKDINASTNTLFYVVTENQQVALMTLEYMTVTGPIANPQNSLVAWRGCGMFHSYWRVLEKLWSY